MRKAISIFVVVALLAASAQAQAAGTVKLRGITCKFESVEVKKGIEIAEESGKDETRKPPSIDPRMIDDGSDSSRLAYVEWMGAKDKYLVFKYKLTNEGDTDSLYVSPTVRFDAIMKATTDGGKMLKQTRIHPMIRPKLCPDPGILGLATGGEVEDVFILEAPAKEAKQVEIELFVWTLMPDVGGTLTIKLPMADGKPADMSKMELSYEAPKEEGPKKKRKIKCKGSAKFGKAQLELLDAGMKKLNYLDQRVGMVFTAVEERMLITFKVKNSGRKPLKYEPVLLQEALPGVVVDDHGKPCTMLGLKSKIKLVDCFNLKKIVPARSEIKDYVVVDPPAGVKALRLILVANLMFPQLKSGSGIAVFRIKFKGGKPSQLRSSSMKKSVNLSDDTLVSMLDQADKMSDEKWDLKYSGLLVNGRGKIVNVEYHEGDNITIFYLSTKENSMSETTYGYVLVMNGQHRSYRRQDEIVLKAVILSSAEMADEWTFKYLVVYGIKMVRTNR